MSEAEKVEGVRSPYHSPQSTVKRGDNGRKRPFLVWVIFLWSLVSVFGLIWSYYLIYVKQISLPDAQRRYLENAPVFDHLLSIFAVVFFVVASLALFYRRPVAVPLFGLRFAFIVSVTIYTFLRQGFSEAMSLGGGYTVIFGPLVALLMFIYVIYLKRKIYFK